MSRLSSMLSACDRFKGFALLALALSNFFLAFKAASVSSSVSPVVVTNRVESVSTPLLPLTGAVDRVSFPFSLPSGSVDTSSPPPPPSVFERCRVDYQYFVCGRRIGAYMFGRYYYDGSPCSYGRIFQIYPDRILLDDGSFITNTRFVGGGSAERIAKNE